MASNLDAALDYIRRGWPVIPIHYVAAKGKCSCGNPDCGSPAKHPMTNHGLKDSTLDEKIVRHWWSKHPNANIGITTGPKSGLVVIDIDPRHGGMESLKALSKLGGFPITPEVFTGGGGEHIYLAHPGNGAKVKSVQQFGGYPGIDIKGDGGYVVAPPSKHISGSKYTWKRHHLKNRVAAIPAWVLTMAETKARDGIPPRDAVHINKSISSLEGCNGFVTLIQKGGRDSAIFNLVKTLRQGGMQYDEVCYHAVMFAKNCCDPPFSEKEAIQKVKSTWNAERNLGAEIRAFLDVTKGVFSLQDVKSALHIVTQKEQTLLRVTLHRLVDANILERLENRAGLFRVIEKELEEITLTDEEDENPLDIKWPFGLENLVDIMPKNIVIVAGMKDSGKSAFCLNAVRMNMHRMDVKYFSSEMGTHELKRRLRRHDDLRISDWRFTAYMRASKFADVIFPESFNVIDYLEISKDFSLIADEIKQIYDKLTTGICLIAIQKDKDAEYGRGKSFSMEKARMYITLDRQQYSNILTIKSGKNWHQEGVNPAGIEIKYKIVNGAKLLEYE